MGVKKDAEAEKDGESGSGLPAEAHISRSGGKKEAEREEEEEEGCQMVCGRTTKVSPSQTLWLSTGMVR